MQKRNYGQVKRQKEAARKQRQLEKLDRRQAKSAGAAPEAPAPVVTPDRGSAD